jgi:TPR repeat protein
VPRIQHLGQNSIPLSPHQEGDAAPESRQQPWKRSRKIDAAPQSTAQQKMTAPWKRSKEFEPFGSGDVTVDLRNNVLASNRLSEPPAPPVRMKRRIALRLAVIPVILATGFVGYELGSGPSAQVVKSAPLPSASPALLSRVSTQQLEIDAAKPRRADASAKLTVSVTVGNNAPINFGVELMTWGDVTKARILFQPVAEAGDGAAAFALAETYDPIVLKDLRLPREAVPDLVLARTWYERARDLGTLEARDRISRLALLPH